MASRRPDHIQERIDFHLARQRARRTHAQPCDCPYCITTARIHELIQANAERNKPTWEDIPF
jgi:hypothetical protein